jgi:hypothetical protein
MLLVGEIFYIANYNLLDTYQQDIEVVLPKVSYINSLPATSSITAA